ncbi:unnamed protein product [Phytophthora fragariaefolia]|uniref:Unnamed protein product n=1 Tax=Phytophthora fragariaefolia TaxID=1490495 RepID=A0A9W6Y7E7_9STRA|nr:unnamed protein product [Phytophthora fragariaefolia]
MRTHDVLHPVPTGLAVRSNGTTTKVRGEPKPRELNLAQGNGPGMTLVRRRSSRGEGGATAHSPSSSTNAETATPHPRAAGVSIGDAANSANPRTSWHSKCQGPKKATAATAPTTAAVRNRATLAAHQDLANSSSSASDEEPGEAFPATTSLRHDAGRLTGTGIAPPHSRSRPTETKQDMGSAITLPLDPIQQDVDIETSESFRGSKEAHPAPRTTEGSTKWKPARK